MAESGYELKKLKILYLLYFRELNNYYANWACVSIMNLIIAYLYDVVPNVEELDRYYFFVLSTFLFLVF